MRAQRVKRAFDLIGSAAGLVALSPLLLAIALAIRFADGPPVFFRQQRVGRNGRPFWIWKFRTMRATTQPGARKITAAGDPRITGLGRLLRRWKLDELPQLWNVLRGEMTLVGPRPEVPEYVGAYTPKQRKVLELTPGLTDPASLEFRNEERLLQEAPDPEQFYIQYCIPRKIELNLSYAERASLWEDLKLILRTIFICARG